MTKTQPPSLYQILLQRVDVKKRKSRAESALEEHNDVSQRNFSTVSKACLHPISPKYHLS